MAGQRSNYYIIDTSSFIDMNKYYPQSAFKSFWNEFEKMITENRVGSPRMVLTELERQDDNICDWAKKYRNPLFHEKHDHYLLVQEILLKYPKLINPRDTKESADPFLIAMALDMINSPQKTLLQYDVCIVTEEKVNKKQNSKKIKIPEVCIHYNIPCFSMIEMILKEGWEF